MKASKITLIVIGIIVLITITVGVTVVVQRNIYKKKLAKHAPYLTNLMGKEKPRDMLKTIKLVKAIEVLDLDEEQMAEFITQWQKTQRAAMDYRKDRAEKIKEIDELLKDKASPQDLTNAITELRALEKDFSGEKQDLQDEIYSVLTPEQQARFILFEKKFNRQMKNFLKKGRGRRKGQQHQQYPKMSGQHYDQQQSGQFQEQRGRKHGQGKQHQYRPQAPYQGGEDEEVIPVEE